ncbi:uncharacterized protein LOC118457428 [Anopheles albimanus]|uniref:uncharacterized protein LOC118457428 n=1 Tax=Anopheles albimanus TaxID=7167 RepID=UPI0016413D4C|nr:uncharacterized protein LOC118457428 [Anopheles albimanus]
MMNKRPTIVAFIMCVLAAAVMAQDEHPLPDYLVFMKQFMVHVQAREPSGIMIWTRDSPLIEMFGIELHIGKHSHSQKEPIWDRQLMVNVTSTVDGKFLIHDRDMIVEVGDTIRYRFLVLHKRTVSHSNYRRMLVTDHLFNRPRNTKCLSECLARDQAGYRQEEARMKEILEHKIEQCVGSQSSEYLFFPLEGAITLVSDPMHFIKYRLWQIEDLRPAIDNVLTAYVAQNGVGVKMRTVIDKLKVLELGRRKINVIDYDDRLTESLN